MTQTHEQQQTISLRPIKTLKRYYAHSPEMVKRLEEISQQSDRRHNDRWTRMKAVLQAYESGEISQLPDMEPYNREREQIRRDETQAILQAIEELGLPLYQRYQQALQATGYALYYHPTTDDKRDFDAIAAKMTRREDGSLTLSVQTIYHFSPDMDEDRVRSVIQFAMNSPCDTWVSTPMPADPSMAGGD